MTEAAWWKGARGEWYVVVQSLLIILIAVGPRTWNGWPSWPFPGGPVVLISGLAFLVGGACLAGAGGATLGAALTPLPYPAANGVLRVTGAFRMVRHPMYSGVILAAFGWALVAHGWLTILYALVGFAFLDVKSRREEQWLVERYPDYPAYQRRIRKLIPFVY